MDDSEAGEVAARLAARVRGPEGSLTLVAVDDPLRRAPTGLRLAGLAPGVRAERRLVEGDPLRSLLAEIERRRATLAVVGTHGHNRAAGIALGSVATHLLHEARCSVLVARATADPAAWPSSIVVGVDGSPESLVAAEAARELGARLGAAVRFVAATHDWVFDLDAARAHVPELEEAPARAVAELHERSERADLVVVGSRGLRGVRSLGSVSERVAHEARCPVLVVRTSTIRP